MRKLRVLLAALLVLSACGRGENDDGAEHADSASLTETSEAAAELLAPVRSLSMATIEFGDAAAQRAERAELRQYAATVAADHRGLVHAIDSIARRRSVQLTETPVAQELANSARMAHAGLDALEPADHDLAFVRAQVESHRQLLDRLEQELLPAATSGEMQRLLQDVRVLEEAHLTRARQILAAILGQSAEPPPPQRTAPPPPPVRPTLPPDTGVSGR
jgi:putative membrane protein